MTYFLSFIYGTAAFYAYKFFPAATITLSLILITSLLLLTLGLFYDNTKKETSQKIAPKNKIISGLLIVIIAIFAFFYANARYTLETPIEEIAGETLLIKGVLDSEPIYRDRFGTYSQIVNINKAFYETHMSHKDTKGNENVIARLDRAIQKHKCIDSPNKSGNDELGVFSGENGSPVSIKKLRLTTDYPLEVNRSYSIKVRIFRYYLNPGGLQMMPAGRAIEIADLGDTDVSSFHKARQKARAKLNNYIKNNFSEKSAPFIMSIVTGERRLLPKEIRDAFSSTGLAHILSISGAHFGLLFTMLFFSFKTAIKTLPYSLLSRLTLYLTPSQIVALLCLPFMAGYLLISDMSVPSVRAFIMINLFLIGLLIGRKGFWLNTLLFAAVVIILMHPDAITELSFQLSFLAVLCIGMAVGQMVEYQPEDKANKVAKQLEQPKWLKRIKSLLNTFVSYGSTSLKITIAATVGIALLIAYYFSYFSIISPLTNAIITPFIGFVILPLALIGSFVYLAFGIFPFESLADAITSFTISAIMHIAEWEFADVNVQSFPLVLLIMFYAGLFTFTAIKLKTEAQPKFKHRKLKLSIAVSIAILPIVIYLIISLTTARGIHITFLDVGQGNSAIVKLPDRKVIVIDTGRTGFQVANFLRHQGINQIDALVLTHGSLDHIGGVNRLLNDFVVREVWDNSRLIYPEGMLDGIVHRRLQRGDTTGGKGYRITVLHPYDGFYTLFHGNEENNDSLVIRIDGIRNSFLFTGDIEHEAQEDLWHLCRHLKSNVIKVPHHGSRTSASEIFFSAVSPEIAVISAGRKNRYGHPHDEMLQLLEGIRVLRTDTDGAIGIREKKNGNLIVRTWSEFRIAEAKSLRDELMNLKKLSYVW